MKPKASIRIVDYENQANNSFATIAKLNKKKVKGKSPYLSKMFALAMCDIKNTIYFFKTKEKRRNARKLLKNFYPNLKYVK